MVGTLHFGANNSAKHAVAAMRNGGASDKTKRTNGKYEKYELFRELRREHERNICAEKSTKQETLLAGHLDLVSSIASKEARRLRVNTAVLPMEDLIIAGLTGLLRGIQTFDRTKGVKPSTWFSITIRREINETIFSDYFSLYGVTRGSFRYASMNAARSDASLSQKASAARLFSAMGSVSKMRSIENCGNIPGDSEHLESLMMRREQQRALFLFFKILEKAMNHYPVMVEIVRHRFLTHLNGYEYMTLKEIAAMPGVNFCESAACVNENKLRKFIGILITDGSSDFIARSAMDLLSLNRRETFEALRELAKKRISFRKEFRHMDTKAQNPSFLGQLAYATIVLCKDGTLQEICR